MYYYNILLDGAAAGAINDYSQHLHLLTVRFKHGYSSKNTDTADKSSIAVEEQCQRDNAPFYLSLLRHRRYRYRGWR